MAKQRNDFLTLKEASRYLRISTQALYDLAQRRRIPSFKVGNRWRFRKSSIDRWVEKKERAGLH